MKHSCPFCHKKAQRFCPALEEYICSKCCGAKRQKEINCEPACAYLPDPVTGIWNDIEKEVVMSFNNEEEDILKHNFDAVAMAEYLEIFLVEYSDEHGTLGDHETYRAIQKLYAFAAKKREDLAAESDFEAAFFKHFHEVQEKKIKPKHQDLFVQTLLRMLKSIKTVTNGPFGNRSYITMLRDVFG